MLGCSFDLDDGDDSDDDDEGAEGEDACHGYFLTAVDLGGLEAVELAEEEGHHCWVLGMLGVE